MTIKEQVSRDIDRWKEAAKGGHKALYGLAVELGYNSRARFPRLKAGLLDHGIDYNALREQANGEKRADMAASVTHKVTLYSDAKARTGRFGITDKDGDPVWYGRFFNHEDAEQSLSEMEAAKKAVYVAKVVQRDHLPPGSVVHLDLRVDAQWLCWANSTDREKGGKAKELSKAAASAGIQLQVSWVSGKENPADHYTICDGYLRLKDNDNLGALPVPA